MAENIRPTKKQRELLEFIQNFIAEHDYSPSYREIMAGLQYTSVATVALHVNNLIKRGHLIRRDGKARSLEVAKVSPQSETQADSQAPEAWFVAQVHKRMSEVENADEITSEHISNLETLLEALSVLDIEDQEHNFQERFEALKI